MCILAYEDGTSELRFSTQDAHNLYIHTIHYKYDANRKTLPPLAGIASDAKILNLGDTYKGRSRVFYDIINTKVSHKWLVARLRF